MGHYPLLKCTMFPSGNPHGTGGDTGLERFAAASTGGAGRELLCGFVLYTCGKRPKTTAATSSSWLVHGHLRRIVPRSKRIWLEGAEKFVIAPLYPIVTIAGDCMEAFDVQLAHDVWSFWTLSRLASCTVQKIRTVAKISSKLLSGAGQTATARRQQ